MREQETYWSRKSPAAGLALRARAAIAKAEGGAS